MIAHQNFGSYFVQNMKVFCPFATFCRFVFRYREKADGKATHCKAFPPAAGLFFHFGSCLPVRIFSVPALSGKPATRMPGRSAP